MRVDQVDQLVYEITSKFDEGITPSEARALIPTPDEDRSIPWLLEVFRDAGIEHESLRSLYAIDFERFFDVGLITKDEMAFVFFFDELRQIVFFKDLETGETQTWAEFREAFKGSEGATFFTQATVLRFFRCQDEAFATIPGVESHWFFKPIWEHRGNFLMAGLASLLTNIFAVGTSLFAMIVYNRIIPSNATSSLLVLVIGMAILLLADYLIKTSRSKLLGSAGVEADLIIADRLFTQVLDVQQKARKGSVGELANTLKEYEHVREFFTSAALVSLIDLPFAMIFVGVIWFLGGSMVFPVLGGIAVLFAVTLYMQPKMKKIAQRSLEDAQSKHSILVETLSGLETVKLLGAGGLLRRRFKSVLARQSEITEESKRQLFFSSNLTQEVQQAVQIGVVAVGALAVADSTYGFGAIIACTILSGKALMPFAQLASLLSRLNQVVSGYKALDALMDAPTEHRQRKSFIRRGRYQGEITFSDVQFSYPGEAQAALDGVSFHVAAGERVAIVGRVGSGKTTIGKLATRLYVPDAGSVALDGVDVEQLDPAEVRENIGYVSQEPWLIAGSIEQNVLLGASSPDPETLIWACNLAGVSDFANSHPEGLKQKVSERGEGLSGGQRQAISLARALVRKPPILLFDEPTSSMDARSERILISRLEEAGLTATFVVITHRTSLLTLVDRVIVVDRGRVIATGSAADFLAGKLRGTSNHQMSPAKTQPNRPSKVTTVPVSSTI